MHSNGLGTPVFPGTELTGTVTVIGSSGHRVERRWISAHQTSSTRADGTDPFDWGCASNSQRRSGKRMQNYHARLGSLLWKPDIRLPTLQGVRMQKSAHIPFAAVVIPASPTPFV